MGSNSFMKGEPALMSYIEWIRQRVGRRKIFLAYTSIALFDERDRILLQHRTDYEAWGLPGGIMEIGEDVLACARRELLEETGLSAGELNLSGIYSEPQYDFTYPNGDQVQQYTLCFKGRMNGGFMQPDGVESSDQRFYRPGEIPFDQVPSFYTAMILDAQRGGSPAFLPPTVSPQTTSQIEAVRRWIGRELYIGVGAGAVVVGSAGRILMLQRLDDGEWDFPAGFLDLGENAAHAAVRETREETGLEVALERILGVHSPIEPWVYPNGDRVQTVATYFRAHITGGELQIDGSEVSRATWMTPAEVRDLRTYPAFMDLKQAAMEHLEAGVFVV